MNEIFAVPIKTLLGESLPPAGKNRHPERTRELQRRLAQTLAFRIRRRSA